MGQTEINKSQMSDTRQLAIKNKSDKDIDFVLEKSIFTNIFEKDIRRVFIYKKAERLAKAIHLITPAFAESVSLKNKIDALAIGLVDAAILPPSTARATLSRELLALSSVLSIARTGGLLSAMNAELISREAYFLLQEIADYEEPRLSLDETPTLSNLVRQTQASLPAAKVREAPASRGDTGKRHIKDTSDISDTKIKDRREAIMSVIKNKGKASIKDISTVIRNVSEKTIQRELIALVGGGFVEKHGERRWSTYSPV